MLCLSLESKLKRIEVSLSLQGNLFFRYCLRCDVIPGLPDKWSANKLLALLRDVPIILKIPSVRPEEDKSK